MNTAAFRSRGPELLQNAADSAKQVLIDFGEKDIDIAEALGVEIAQRWAKDWAGQNIYVPIGCRLKSHRLALQVWDEFTGNNIHELARKYQMSVQWVYTIIRNIRTELNDKNQGRLF